MTDTSLAGTFVTPSRQISRPGTVDDSLPAGKQPTDQVALREPESKPNAIFIHFQNQIITGADTLLNSGAFRMSVGQI